MIVGLFGYYSDGNFGDNLMAYMLCRHLESLGVGSVIYSTDGLFPNEYGMRIEPSLAAFIESCDIVVLGGGGLLTPSSRGTKRFTSEMRDLVSLCRERKVPIYAISIGGNGIPLEQIEPVERRELIAASEYTTLRNPEDMQVLKDACRPGESIPDIVWTAPQMLPRQSERSSDSGSRRRVGVNIYTRSKRRRRWLEYVFRGIVRYRRDIDFVFISVSADYSLNDATIGSSHWGANCTTVALHEIHSAANLLASLDCLITSKLHIGMTAMSFGVPVVSYAGEPKTRLVYKRIGLERMVWDAKELHRLIALLLSRRGLNGLRTAFVRCDRDVLTAEAMKHYAVLTDIVQRQESEGAAVASSVRADGWQPDR